MINMITLEFNAQNRGFTGLHRTGETPMLPDATCASLSAAYAGRRCIPNESRILLKRGELSG